jgi:hypothetical protein
MKRLLLTGGLLGALGLTLLVVNDATHPQLAYDECSVKAVASGVDVYKPAYKLLYRNGDNPLHDVALDCRALGKIWLNEPPAVGAPSGASPGKPVHIKTKTYHFFPKQWRITVDNQPNAQVVK